MPVHVDRSLRLPESEYFASPEAKSGVALLGTAGVGVVIGRAIR